MDDTLQDLAGFGPIEERDDSEGPEPALHDEIDELAYEIEAEITRMEQRLNEVPNFPSRPQRVGGTIQIEEMV